MTTGKKSFVALISAWVITSLLDPRTKMDTCFSLKRVFMNFVSEQLSLCGCLCPVLWSSAILCPYLPLSKRRWHIQIHQVPKELWHHLHGRGWNK